MKYYRYTAAERRAIDRAYSAAEYICDHLGGSAPYKLADGLRHERRERSSVTVARALMVAGFANGRRHDPRASAVACVSAGIATATIVGAASRRLKPRDFTRGQYIRTVLRTFPALAAAAAAAHDSYMRRGFDAIRGEMATETARP